MSLMRNLNETRLVAGKTGADIYVETPGDVYTYGHHATNRAGIKELARIDGVGVIDYFNFFHSHEAAKGWSKESFQGWLYAFCQNENLWLTTKDGHRVRFFAGEFGNGPIVNIAKMSPMQLSMMGSRMLQLRFSPWFWLDQVRTSLRDWMFLDGVTLGELEGYSRKTWVEGMDRIFRALNVAGIRLLLNGDNAVWPGVAASRLDENLDWERNRGRWDEAIGEWVDDPYSVIGLVGGIHSELVSRVLPRALTTESILWLKDVEAHAEAWRMRQEVR